MPESLHPETRWECSADDDLLGQDIHDQIQMQNDIIKLDQRAWVLTHLSATPCQCLGNMTHVQSVWNIPIRCDTR